MSDLPLGWSSAVLPELVASGGVFSDGDWIESKDQDPSGDVRLIQLADVGDGFYRDRSARFLTLEKAHLLGCTFLKSGDVLIARMPDPLGRACCYPGDPKQAVTVVDVCIVRPGTESVNPRWLMHMINAPQLRSAMIPYEMGTTRKRISRGNLARIPLPVPPFAEQQRILAAIEEQFSRLDAGVAALERVRKNLRRMRSAAFALIADSVDTWVTLGEIAQVVGGVTRDAKRQFDPSFVEVPYLRVANVQRGYLDLSAVTTIRVPTTTVEKLCLEPGDILFNEGGDRDKLGRGWVWEGKIKDCIHQNHVFRARLLTDQFDPRFVSMHGNTFGRKWFEKMGKQTTNLASLNLTTLRSFPVPNFPVERQREIVAEVERRLSLIDSLQSATDDSLARCNSLRSSILAAAFCGTLVPQDSTDEPASALLERIAAERAPSNGRSPARTRRPRTPQEKVVV